MSYIAKSPMNRDRIFVGTFVYVPVWLSGRVIGWDYGHVVNVQDPECGYYIVCLMTAPYDGKKQGYYGYSLACGICYDREDTSKCFQCVSRNDIDHAECYREFPQKAAQGIDAA